MHISQSCLHERAAGHPDGDEYCWAIAAASIYAPVFGGTLIGLGLRRRSWFESRGLSAATVGFR